MTTDNNSTDRIDILSAIHILDADESSLAWDDAWDTLSLIDQSYDEYIPDLLGFLSWKKLESSEAARHYSYMGLLKMGLCVDDLLPQARDAIMLASDDYFKMDIISSFRDVNQERHEAIEIILLAIRGENSLWVKLTAFRMLSIIMGGYYRAYRKLLSGKESKGQK